MLRSLIIIGSPLLLVGVLFYLIVLRAQPNSAGTVAADNGVEASKVRPTVSKSGFGPGSRPYTEIIEHGRVTSEFKADEYTPQKDGSFSVTNPVYIMFLSDGQRLHVAGDSGVINCDTAGSPDSPMLSGANAQPKNGWLHNVRIELFHENETVHPSLWMETNNIHFDNDTLRIFTESYTDPATGQHVDGDQVPVTMRGDDYEFDGNGLTVWWNNKSRRLQRLEIAHGKRLEIKNPTKISLPGMAPAQAPAKLAVHRAAVQETPPSSFPLALKQYAYPGLLASSDASAFTLALDARPAPADQPTPYRAVFNDDVKIADSERTLAVASLMLVDFLQAANKPKTESVDTIPPPPAPVPPAPVPAAPVVQPTDAAAPSNPALPAKSPTTKPLNGPVTITWTGKLLVTPLETVPILPMVPGQSVIQLVGTSVRPVQLTPQGSTVLAGTATYRSPDGAVQLTSPAGSVVQMSRDTGMTLTTGSIDYDPSTALAVLHGQSHLQVPVGKDKMLVDWTDLGQLHMIKAAGQSQPSGVDQINLNGEVTVDHPQFSLDSQQLQLNLAPGDAQPNQGGEQLKLLTATDRVNCRLKHPGQADTQGINSDALTIRTAQVAKQTVAREVIAVGNVHAFDPDQSITAGSLDALLAPKANAAPATNPTDAGASAVELESLAAKTNVHALLKNGSTADADELHIVGMGRQQKISLTGTGGATLTDGKNSWLKGPTIDITPDQSIVEVNGPGSMRTIRKSPATQPADASPPRPFDVSWTDRMKLNGAANVVDLFGKVLVTNVDAIGTRSTITGDTAHLDLIDAPKSTTNPAAAPSDSLASATGGKQLKKLTMTGHIAGTSDLSAADGTILRQGRLYCRQLMYTPSDGSAIIPGAGKMYVENHQPNPNAGAGAKGAMAISWQKNLVYQEAQRTITFTGDAIVGFEQDQQTTRPAHKPADAPDQSPMQLKSNQVIVTLAAPSSTQNAATAAQPAMKVSDMLATGQVRFNAKGVELTCANADYNPATGILTATGTANEPVEVLAGQVTGSFDSVQYDATSQEVTKTTGSHIRSQQ